MSKIIGIDLGTTNSCVAILEGGDPASIPNMVYHASIQQWSRAVRVLPTLLPTIMT